MKLFNTAVVAAMMVGVAGAAMAEGQPTREEMAIKFRRASYTVLMKYVGEMGAMAKGDKPYDKALFCRDADYLAVLSKLPKDGFMPGSDTGDTKAKPEIWSKADKFKEANDNFEKESAKLAEVAKAGNLDAIKEQYGKMTKTCKACHEDFKKKAE